MQAGWGLSTPERGRVGRYLPGLRWGGRLRPMLHRVQRCSFWLSTLLAASCLPAASLPQEVYVWQRGWTAPVQRAVVEHGGAFSRVVVLRAEVTWNQGKPQVAQVPVDYAALAQTGRPIGLALRVGPYPGSFDRTNGAAVFLSDLAQKLVLEARAAGLKPSELQLDFDCATSKLEGYRMWVGLIRECVAPVPLVITVLPKSFDADFTLLDPAAARQAVARASGLGVPFRVALPTYGYTVAFDRRGGFIGLSAEGPAKSWPAGARLKEVRSNPLEIAPLVQAWASNPPPALAGIIWYRLPTIVDNLCWRWPTLNAMVLAQILRKSVRVDTHRVESGLTEISLVNDGELDISSRLAVQTRWRGACLVAGDGLRGFELADRGASSARFVAGTRPHRLPAGEKQVIGWLRLSEDREVQGELVELDER
jgi:hypothetical protein